MRKLALLLSIIALTLAVTTAARANTVTRTVVTVNIPPPGDLWPEATSACGFPVYLTGGGSFKVTSYFDNSGTLLKVIGTLIGGPFRVTASNPVTGKSATTQTEPFADITIFNSDGSVASESLNGLLSNFVAPGVGSLLLTTGRLVFDGNGNLMFEAGPHALLDPNAWSRFCDYLADP